MKSLKQSTNVKKSLVLLVIVLALYSCKKDSSSLPATKATQVAFAVKADNLTASLAASAPGLAVNAITTPVIQFSAGIANVAKFKLEAKTASSKIEIETKNLLNIDLFAITPASINATLDTGTYKQIEISVLLAQSATTVPLILKGSFTATDGSVVPVEFDINDNFTIKSEAKNVVLKNSADLSAMVVLHLGKMVAGITAADLNGATRTSGVIIISNTSNTTLLNKIKLNIESCGDTEVKPESETHGNGGGNDGANHG